MLPVNEWEGQKLPTGTFNLEVDTEQADPVVRRTEGFDVATGEGSFMFNHPPGDLAPGWYGYFACYSGDSNYEKAGQDCGALGESFQMYRHPSTTKVTVEPNPARYGSQVTITAQVTDAAGKPLTVNDGYVLFEWYAPNGRDGHSVPVVNGMAQDRGYLREESALVHGQFIDPSSEYATSWKTISVPVAKGLQHIDFAPMYDLPLGDDQAVIAASNSGLEVDLETTTPDVCTLRPVPGGVSVTAESRGTCSVTASQDGNNLWEAAEPVTRTFDVVRRTAHLSYPDGQAVVKTAMAPLSPQTDLSGDLRFTAAGLPQGLRVNRESGQIAGTPMESTHGPQPVTVRVRDNSDRMAGATLTINVRPQPVEPTVSYPTGKGWVGKTFTAQRPSAVGFEGSVSYRVAEPFGPSPVPASGLPPGLRVKADSGAIVGTPRSAGVYTPTIVATDGIRSATTSVRISIGNGKRTPTLRYAPGLGVLATPFVPLKPQASGLGGNVRFRVDRLPPGLTIKRGSGSIVGTPAKRGRTTSRVTVTGDRGTARAAVTIRIRRSPLRPQVSYPDIRTRRGRPLTPVVPTVTGISAPLRYSARGLAAGLSVARESGTLTGTPRKAAEDHVVVRVRGRQGSAKDRFIIVVTGG